MIRGAMLLAIGVIAAAALGQRAPASSLADTQTTAPHERLIEIARNDEASRLFRAKKHRKLCRNRRIRGERAETIPGRMPGCGLENGVRVYTVNGVSLSRPATMDCNTAKALELWVRRGLKPAVGRTGGGVAELEVAAHYVCRTRNHKRGAPISEHGKGKAIDISAIKLKNGAELDVLTGWNHRTQGPILRQAHKAACGPFGTVLGPRADRHHRDHFHFDTARHRNGPYCR
ncbi:MAG: extensin family protein [Pseudomonadota bacterium]